MILLLLLLHECFNGRYLTTRELGYDDIGFVRQLVYNVIHHTVPNNSPKDGIFLPSLVRDT